MMLIMSIVCLLKTLNRYIRLDETLRSVNYVKPYVLQILEKIYVIWLISEDIGYFLAGFR